jgi:hypothetical protein
LEAGLLEDLGLLVCVDDLGGNELVEVLVGMAGNESIGLGSIGLSIRVLVSEQRKTVVTWAEHTIFLFTLRIFLQKLEVRTTFESKRYG